MIAALPCHGVPRRPRFQKYVHLIGKDFGMDTSTRDGDEKVWTVMKDMPSFRAKGECLKFKRWFSINECWHQLKT